MKWEHKWKSTTINVNIETGEIIEKKELKNFIKIKTIKNVTKNKRYNGGTIEYINEWEPSKQGQLFATPRTD